MPERIPNGVAKLVVFRAIASADHFTPSTGKTIAITISKNGATSFSNPNAGATNATEMASGFYKFTLDTTDTGTNGPLAWRAAGTGVDDIGDVYEVVNATNAGFTALPNVASGSAGAVLTSGTGTAQLSVSSGLVTLAGVTHTGAVIPTVTTTTTATNVTTVNGLAANVITATSIAADAITDAKVASDVTIASVTGSVGSVATGGIAAASFAAGAIDAAAIATGAIDADALATDAVTEIADGLLARDLGSGTNALTAQEERTVRSALRTVRNKSAAAAGTLTVYTENDTTVSHTAALTTDAAAVPIITVDPA